MPNRVDVYKILSTSHISPNEDRKHNYTKVLPGGIGGKYYIDSAIEDKFLDYYGNCFKEEPFHLTQTPDEIKPINLDFDFRIPGVTDRQYTDSGILELVAEIHRILSRIYPNPTGLVFVLKRPVISIESGIQKDGLHIQLPDFVSARSVQRYLRNQLLNFLNGDSEFGRIVARFRLSPDQIIDKGIPEKTSWMLYGSRKGDNLPYLLNYALRLESGGEQLNLTDLAAIGIPESSLPKLLSIHRKDSDIRPVRLDALEILAEYETIKKIIPETSDGLLIIDQELVDIIRECVSVLAEFRRQNYEDWMRLGFCLATISRGDTRIRDIWLNFSTKDPRKSRDLWDHNDQARNTYSLDTLYRWVKMDAPGEYRRIIEKDLTYCIVRFEGDKWSHYDIAKLIYRLYPDRFAVDYRRKAEVYEFHGHIWKIQNSNMQFSYLISEEIRQKFEQASRILNERILQKATAKQDRTFEEMQQKKIIRTVSILGDHGFKTGVIQELHCLYSSPGFIDRLNVCTKLLSFTNGILEIGTFTLRNGQPDDMISVQLKYPYQPYRKEDAVGIKDFFRKIFPMKDLRKYVKSILASCIEGNTLDNHAYFLWGRGGNGKSRLVDLITEAFDPKVYMATIKISTFVTRRNAPGSADPNIAPAVGKHIVITQETTKREIMNSGFFKEWLGLNIIPYRELYDHERYFRPKFRTFFQVNHLPKFTEMDDGIARRPLVLPTLAKFVGPDLPEDRERWIFRQDPNLPDNISSWSRHFIAYLAHIYRKNLRREVKVPEIVLTYTRQYLEANDRVKRFFTTTIRQDTSGQIILDQLIVRMNLFNDNYQDKELKINVEDLRDYLADLDGFDDVLGILRGWSIIPI